MVNGFYIQGSDFILFVKTVQELDNKKKDPGEFIGPENNRTVTEGQ
jgi:hypothetical protein